MDQSPFLVPPNVTHRVINCTAIFAISEVTTETLCYWSGLALYLLQVQSCGNHCTWQEKPCATLSLFFQWQSGWYFGSFYLLSSEMQQSLHLQPWTLTGRHEFPFKLMLILFYQLLEAERGWFVSGLEFVEKSHKRWWKHLCLIIGRVLLKDLSRKVFLNLLQQSFLPTVQLISVVCLG